MQAVKELLSSATFWAAVAAVAALVGLWSLRSRPRVTVDVNFYHPGVPAPPLPKTVIEPDQYLLGIDMTNTGKRAVTIKQAGVKVSPPEVVDGTLIDFLGVFDSQLPKLLEPGASHTTIARPGQVSKDRIIYGAARDTEGHEWRSKKWPLK